MPVLGTTFRLSSVSDLKVAQLQVQRLARRCCSLRSVAGVGKVQRVRGVGEAEPEASTIHLFVVLCDVLRLAGVQPAEGLVENLAVQ